MPIGSAKLAGESLEHRNKLADSVKLLLLWMAASDDELEETELEYVSAQFPDITGTISTTEFLSVIRESDLNMIAKAVRFVAGESRELRTAFIDMAITMSMADHDIAIPENHILRFYADALHLGQGNLEKRFQAITGIALPDPGDPSSPDWWDPVSGPEHGNELSEEELEKQIDDAVSRDSQVRDMTIARAHTVLGLSLNASPKDIELAYQSLARVFEVDHEEAMGAAAVSNAHASFRKIQQAYRLLRKEVL